MKWFLFFVSLLWIVAGCGYILYTRQFREVMGTLIKGINEKIIAVLAVVFGILLILGASLTRHEWFIMLLGIIAIIKGVFIFLDPKGYWQKVKAWYVDQASDQTFRLFGIIALILGTALFSWISSLV